MEDGFLSQKWNDEARRIGIRRAEERHFGPKSRFFADLNRCVNRP